MCFLFFQANVPELVWFARGLLREQHEAEAKKEGPLTWRPDEGVVALQSRSA